METPNTNEARGDHPLQVVPPRFVKVRLPDPASNGPTCGLKQRSENATGLPEAPEVRAGREGLEPLTSNGRRGKLLAVLNRPWKGHQRL